MQDELIARGFEGAVARLTHEVAVERQLQVLDSVERLAAAA